MSTVDIMMLSSQLEKMHETDKFSQIIPYLSFPRGFSFRVSFPFCGAYARFRVRKDSNPEDSVSVYLDAHNVLGCFGSPYWEAYPIKKDTARFPMEDSEELLKCVVKELKDLERKKKKL